MNIETDEYEDLFRLPDTVCPTHYKLFLHPDLENSTFIGDVKIDIDVKDTVSRLILNSHQLIITNAKVCSKVGSACYESFQVDIVLSQPKSQLIILLLKSNLKAGKYSIVLSYKGVLGSNTVGFYRSTTNVPEQNVKYCALTYFEPTYARFAFPCFDEPHFKAKFSVSLVRPSSDGYIALSNGILEKEIIDFPSEGLTTSYFSETELMSTYLTCFIVGEFTRLPPAKPSSGDLPISVYTRPHLVQKTQFVRDFAASVIDFFSKYFDIYYTFPKLDLIGIPDSKIGAMENWGLVTFRESCILIDEDESSSDDYLCAVGIVAHELTHMWFGNLVTPRWWDDLWLKEGMAHFLSYVACRNVFQSWFNEWVFLKQQTLPVLVKDSALCSHPIVQQVLHPDEIREIFDPISYEKGSCLLRMVYELDPNKFQLGLKTYLTDYKWSTATTNDLWNSFAPAFHLPIASLLDPWTSQVGYPLVTVTKEEKTVYFRQSRFLAHVDQESDSTDVTQEYKWDIPIKYITSDAPKHVKTVWFGKTEDTVLVDYPAEIKWIKLNWHNVGYFRVNYPVVFWKQFSSILLENVYALDEEDRCNLVNDAFCLASAGYIEYSVPLTLILYLKTGNEDSFLIWSVLHSNVKKLKTMLKGTPSYVYFMKYMDVILSPLISQFQWDFSESIPFRERKLRVELLRIFCFFGYESALERVRKIFKDWVTQNNPVPPELRTIVFRFGLSGTDVDALWETTWHMFKKENDPKKIKSLLQVLAYASSPCLLKRLIKEAKNTELVKFEDFCPLLQFIADNPAGNEIVWNFLTNEWSYLMDRFTCNDLHLGYVVSSVASLFSTEQELLQVQEFYESTPNAGAMQTERYHSIEAIKSNIRWKQNYLPFIHQWLKHFISQL